MSTTSDSLSTRLAMLAMECYRASGEMTGFRAERVNDMGEALMFMKRMVDLMGDELTAENVNSTEALLALSRQVLDKFMGRGLGAVAN